MVRILSFLWVGLVYGWDSDGHTMVAKMAASLLTKPTARFVLKNIQGRDIGSNRMTRIAHTLVSVASWADYISEELPWSRALHFASTPYRKCQAFDLIRDCESERCVVTAIANYTTIASSYSLSPEERGEALKFLIHFVADIHSPMHVAFAKDFGGNGIPVVCGDGAQSTTLHEVWDRHIIDAIKGERSWKELVDSSEIQSLLVNSPVSVPSTADGLEFATEIASETSTQVTCKLGYKREDGSWIKPRSDVSEYIEYRKDVVLSQLVKSAHRLAALLEGIAAEYNTQKVAAETQAAQLSSSALASSFETSPNQFSLLDDILYDVEDPMDIVDEVVNEPSMEKAVVDESVTEEASVVVVDDSLTLDDLVLISRKGDLYIVPRRGVYSNRWIPREVNEHIFTGIYRDNDALVRFDARIPIPLRTGESAKEVWREVIAKESPWLTNGSLTKLYISNIPEIKFGSVVFDKSWAMAIPAGQDRTEFALAQLRRNMANLVIYYDTNVLLVTSMDIVKASAAAVRRGDRKLTAMYNTFGIQDDENALSIDAWVDARVYDGGYCGELVDIIMEAYTKYAIANLELLRSKSAQHLWSFHRSYSDFMDRGATSDAARVMGLVVSQINHVIRPSGERLAHLSTFQVDHRLLVNAWDNCGWTDRYGNPDQGFLEPLGSISKRGGIDVSPIERSRAVSIPTHFDDLDAKHHIASIVDELVIFRTGRFYFVTLLALLREDPKAKTFTVTFVPIDNGGGGTDPDVYIRANMDFLVVDERVHSGSMAPIVDVILRASKKRGLKSNLNKLITPRWAMPEILVGMELLGLYRDMLVVGQRKIELLREMEQRFSSIRPVVNPQYTGLLRTFEITLTTRR